MDPSTQQPARPPAAEYARRLQARQQEQANLASRFALQRRGKTVVVGLVVVLAVLAERETAPVKVALLLGPALLLDFLIRRRARTSLARRRSEWVAGFYRQRLACVEGRWAGTGEAGSRFLDECHPCALDLDLFGPGCLFERLCTARTCAGQDALAAWLLAPATPEEVRRRQAAVAELRPRLDFRERLALLAAEVPAGDFTPLAEWGAAPQQLGARLTRWVVWLSGAFALGALVVGFFGATILPILLALLLQGILALSLRARLRALLGPVEGRGPDVAPLAAVLAFLEGQTFTSERLRPLGASCGEGRTSASRRLARLARLLNRSPLAYLLLARPQLALLVEGWRRSCGAELGRSLAVLGEFEALSSLAAYAWEEPDNPFPEVIEGGPCFDAEGLGHPLLPRARCVANDLRLDGELRVLVVSGSNMSGKSTLLRTVGVSVVLALAGAPVRAVRLRLSPLVVGATLRVQDSLQAGISRFQAEVLRVRQLLDLAKDSPPLLFLLDEMFQGTNSHDRRVGAEGVIRRLVEAGALGLVTTHDLALTEIADRLAPRGANVHFEDAFEGAGLSFDYRMKPGVVRTSNGLALMRAVGIEV